MANKILIVAHAANSKAKIENSLKWADLAEIDLSCSIWGKFTVQHNGFLGKLGIGKSFNKVVNPEFTNKILLDLKHPQWTFKFVNRFIKFVLFNNLTNCLITSDHWPTIRKLAKNQNFKAFYYLRKEKDKEKFLKILPIVSRPEGVIVQAKHFSKQWLKKISKYKLKVIVVYPREEDQITRLAKIGVWAVITNSPINN